MKTKTKLFFIFIYYFFLGVNIGCVIFGIIYHSLNILNIIAVIMMLISDFYIDWVTYPNTRWKFNWRNIYSSIVFLRSLYYPATYKTTKNND